MPTPGSTFPTAWNRKERYGNPESSDPSAHYPGGQTLLGWSQRGQADAAEVRGLRQAVLLSTRALSLCSSRRISWIQASGKGKLYSFEIAYQNFNPAYKIKPPYIFAMIELDEGPHMMSNLINIDPDPKVVKCDMPVEVVFEKLTDEVTIPLFQPAK